MYTYQVCSGAHGGQEMALAPHGPGFYKSLGADNVVPAIEPRSSIVAANAFGHQAQPQISVLNA